MTNQQTKSKERVANHGEVFTAEREVNAMLDLVKQETERIESRFLEPACGNGNFLAEILRRKLAVVKSLYGKNPDDYERYAVLAVTSIYGVDILEDNVEECRDRMFDIFDKEYAANCKDNANDDTRKAVRHILRHNILCGDALNMVETVDGKPKLTPDGEQVPLEFAEWSLVNSCLLKRRDFSLTQLLNANEKNLQLDLFGEVGRYELDPTTKERLPLPVRQFPPIYYRRLGDNE